MALRSESERRAAPVGHLYVLTRSDAPDVVKVGRDADPARHAGELQTGHCFHVNVAAVFPRAGEHVSAVQAALQRYRVTPGAGWFRCSVGEALATIADVMAETGGCTEVGVEAGGWLGGRRERRDGDRRAERVEGFRPGLRGQACYPGYLNDGGHEHRTCAEHHLAPGQSLPGLRCGRHGRGRLGGDAAGQPHGRELLPDARRQGALCTRSQLLAAAGVKRSDARRGEVVSYMSYAALQVRPTHRSRPRAPHGLLEARPTIPTTVFRVFGMREM